MATLITGLFRKRIAAEAAVEVILKRGIRRENIGVLLSDATENKELGVEPHTRAASGAGSDRRSVLRSARCSPL